MRTYKILDTSKHQGGRVDYVAAKKAGYIGVILRIGCGKTKDVRFEGDYKRAVAAGLLVGGYDYTYSTTTVGSIQDATRVLGWLNGKHLDLPVYYDMEDKRQKGESRRAVNSAMYNAFADKIRPRYAVGLYSGEYFFNNYFDKTAIKDKLWIARYSAKAPNVGRQIEMWQYTSDAFANDFYKGKLDRSYWYVANDIIAPEIGNPYAEPTRTLCRRFPMIKGDDVRWLQWELGITTDGKFGNGTRAAVLSYQKSHSLKQDGKVGPATRFALKND